VKIKRVPTEGGGTVTMLLHSAGAIGSSSTFSEVRIHRAFTANFVVCPNLFRVLSEIKDF